MTTAKGGAPIGHTLKRQVAKGTRIARHPGKVRLIVDVDEETFAHLRHRALLSGTSMAEQIRTVIEWGLDSEKPRAKSSLIPIPGAYRRKGAVVSDHTSPEKP